MSQLLRFGRPCYWANTAGVHLSRESWICQSLSFYDPIFMNKPIMARRAADSFYLDYALCDTNAWHIGVAALYHRGPESPDKRQVSICQKYSIERSIPLKVNCQLKHTIWYLIVNISLSETSIRFPKFGLNCKQLNFEVRISAHICTI